MKKRTLILLMTILILGFIISCDDVPLPNNGGVQTFDYTPEFYSDLDHYLKDLNDNYSYFPKTGTYDENEFREVTGYNANKIYPEIGTFLGISSIDELGYGIKKFKSGEKVRIRMGSSSYIEDEAFVSDSYGINGPAPVIMLEFIFGDPVLTLNGESYPLEDFTSTTNAHISSALWYNERQNPLTPGVDEGLFSSDSINTGDPSSIKSLEFQFSEKPEFFFTKATFFNKKDKLNTIYSFEKPNAEGKLEFVIEKNTDQKEYDSILYYVAMLSDDGKYYAKTIIIDID